MRFLLAEFAEYGRQCGSFILREYSGLCEAVNGMKTTSQKPEHSKTEVEDSLGKTTRLWNVALILEEVGKYNRAEELLVQGLDHPDTLSSMSKLALIYRDQGHWGEAEKLEVTAHLLERIGDDVPITEVVNNNDCTPPR